MDGKEIRHVNDAPLKVLLQKTRDCYNLEIHISGRSITEMLPQIREANNKLKGEYGGKK